MRSRPVDLRPSDSELAPAANHLKGDVICDCASGSGSRPSPRLPFTVLVHAFTPLGGGRSARWTRGSSRPTLPGSSPTTALHSTPSGGAPPDGPLARWADRPGGALDKQHLAPGRTQTNGRTSTRDRGGRQLHHLPDPGRRVLQGRRPGGHRPGSHARPLRRLPRQRCAVRRSVRRRREEGRVRPLRGDPGVGEQHHQDRRRPTDRGDRAAAARWTAWASTTARPSRRPRATGWTSSRCSGTREPTCSCPTCPWARSGRTSSTRSARSTRASRSSTRCRSSSPPTRSGRRVRGRRPPGHRGRRQVAGRRHHHPPGDGEAVRGPRRGAGPHVPAQRRRQHGLQEHARARAPGSRRSRRRGP